MVVARMSVAAKDLLPIYLACALALVVAGCQTTGSTSGEVTYGLFFSPADHIEELLAQDDYRAASEVYEAERDYFSEESEKRQLAGSPARQITSIEPNRRSTFSRYLGK